MARSAAASEPCPVPAPTLHHRAAHHGLVAAVAAETPAFAASAALVVRWAETWWASQQYFCLVQRTVFASDCRAVLACVILRLFSLLFYCIRWMAAHMFSGALAPEAAELLTAAAFTGPSSLPQPGATAIACRRSTAT